MFDFINASKYYHNYPLASKLLGYILLCSSLITLFATIFQIAMDYKKDVNSIKTRLHEIEISRSKTISLSVWNFNDYQIDSLMTGILVLPDIKYIEIRTEIKLYSMGNKPVGNFLSHEFELPIIQDSYELGSVFIAAGLENVYQRIKERVIIILGSQAIKTFIVSFFILFIIRYLVTRHLNTMAEFARHLDLKKLDRFLVLDRKNQKNKDELDRVIQAINQMIKNLARAAKEMETQARIQGELDAGAIIQKACTPEKLPSIDNFEMAAQFHPAMEMSGDYFDVIKIDDRYVAFVVADVSGKGVSAAMYANITRVLLRDKERFQSSPAKLLCALNQSLKKEFHANHFLTMNYVVLDTQNFQITYASAGHEPLILIRKNEKKIRLLKPHGYPFSELHADLFDKRICQETLSIQAGDLLFAYTDGLIDAENEAGEMFGEERLYRILLEHHHLPVSKIYESLLQKVWEFKGDAQQNDDITMVILKRPAKSKQGESLPCY